MRDEARAGYIGNPPQGVSKPPPPPAPPVKWKDDSMAGVTPRSILPTPVLIPAPGCPWVVNPEVVKVHAGYVLVRFPDGSGMLVNKPSKRNPEQLRDLLFDWLSAHIEVVRSGMCR